MNETDPTGKDAHEPGAKLDAGKPRMGLVLLGFHRALKEVCKVGTLGAAKYSDFGWMSVPLGVDRYTDAMLRHLFEECVTENDKDLDVLHASQVAWNALARLELIIRSNDNDREMEAYEYDLAARDERGDD